MSIYMKLSTRENNCQDFSIDKIVKYFVSYCENCGEPIFEYDTYFVATLSDKEIYFCRDCCREG